MAKIGQPNQSVKPVKDMMASGGGRPFEMNDWKRPSKKGTRHPAKLINLDDLEQPGRGPCNFVRHNGFKLNADTGYLREEDLPGTQGD